jgi:hypothetical protein
LVIEMTMRSKLFVATVAALIIAVAAASGSFGQDPDEGSNTPEARDVLARAQQQIRDLAAQYPEGVPPNLSTGTTPAVVQDENGTYRRIDK